MQILLEAELADEVAATLESSSYSRAASPLAELNYRLLVEEKAKRRLNMQGELGSWGWDLGGKL